MRLCILHALFAGGTMTFIQPKVIQAYSEASIGSNQLGNVEVYLTMVPYDLYICSVIV